MTSDALIDGGRMRGDFRICARCGQLFSSVRCPHYGTARNNISDAEALRIQARYALGRLHNPDHDATSYRDTPETQDPIPMTTKITIEVPANDYAVRVALEIENSRDVEIHHVGPGASESFYIYQGRRIVEISEVKVGDIKIGKTHTGKLGAPVDIDSIHDCVAKDTQDHELRQRAS